MEDALKKYNRTFEKMYSMQSSLAEAEQKFLEVQSDFQEKERSIAKVVEELEDQRQATKRQEKAVEDWRNAAISFLEAQQNTLSHINLSEDRRQAVEKSVKDFLGLAEGQGLDVIRPQAGEEMNDKLHRHAGENESEQYMNGEILECKAWGYRYGGDILKPAQVIVAKLATQRTETDCDHPLSVAPLTIDQDQPVSADAGS